MWQSESERANAMGVCNGKINSKSSWENLNVNLLHYFINLIANIYVEYLHVEVIIQWWDIGDSSNNKMFIEYVKNEMNFNVKIDVKWLYGQTNEVMQQWRM